MRIRSVMGEIWFWQRIISPHMVGLARELVRLGHDVKYVVEAEMSSHRAKLGWKVPSTSGLSLKFMRDRKVVSEYVSLAAEGSIHFCQGLYRNGLVSFAQKELSRRSLNQWVVMETVNDASFGKAKRIFYRWLISTRGKNLAGILAIGHRTTHWLTECGMPPDKVWPFAYFLDADRGGVVATSIHPTPYIFLFVGRLDVNKRVSMLIRALSALPKSSRDYRLLVVGVGDSEATLKKLADEVLPARVSWLGAMSRDLVPMVLRRADCLVLPSLHDGWGAVVSEALMVGTPVICSDTCGAAGVVRASKSGGVFAVHDQRALQRLLTESLMAGPVPQATREHLTEWAKSLNAESGARYMDQILRYAREGGSRPPPPWTRDSQ